MWMTLNAEQQSVINEIQREIDRQGDRSVVLICSAFLEHRLELGIRQSFTEHPKVQNSLFAGNGPLGSFSAKIDLGLLLGHYDEHVHRLLHHIRRIRNEFAHSFDALSFDTPRIADRCNTLMPVNEGESAPAFEDFSKLAAAGKLGEWLIGSIFNTANTPRNRFVATVQLLLAVLTLAAHIAREYKQPFEVLRSSGKLDLDAASSEPPSAAK